MIVAGLIAWSIVVVMAGLAAVAATLVMLGLRIGGFRQLTPAERDVIAASRLTLPVSIVVPLCGNELPGDLEKTIGTLLDLSYSKFEVIVVGNEPLAGTDLKSDWQLEARELFYRAALPTAPVRALYRSVRDPRLLVVDKAPAVAGDALNCGVNLARFRYVLAVDAGVTCDEGALLRALTEPLRDPAVVACATSHVEIERESLQGLRSTRALMRSRLPWRLAHATLGGSDAAVVWRRDLIVQAGGFSAAADPHLDLALRLQSTARVPALVVRTAEIFGRSRSRTYADYVHRTAQRHLATLQAVSSVLGEKPALIRMAAEFVAVEIIMPLMQAWVVVAATIGAAAGWWHWIDAALVVGVLAFGHAVVTCTGLLLRGALESPSDGRRAIRLLLVSPLEFVVLGLVNTYARFVAIGSYLRSASARQRPIPRSATS